MEKKKLIILSGLPGSGKSTVVKKYFNDEIIIENDALRLKLGLAHTKEGSRKLTEARDELLTNHLCNGDTVVLDGVWSNKKARRKIYELAKQYGYSVEVLLVVAAMDTVYARQLTRTKEDKVPDDIILNMAKYYNFPEIGYDCDILSCYSSEEEKLDIDAYNKDLLSLRHESIHHLETIGTHIKMVTNEVEKLNISDKEKDILIDVAKWHDFGKKHTKASRFGRSSYIGHQNVSALSYLANVCGKEITVLNDTKELFIVNLISEHMRAHDKLEAIVDYNFEDLSFVSLIGLFATCDDNGRLYTPMMTLNQDKVNVKCRKYIFAHNYSPMKYFYDGLNAIKRYDLSTVETQALIEESVTYFKMRSAIFTQDNRIIANGLEAFFNVGQFDWLEMDDCTEAELLWKEFFKSLGTPHENHEKFTKVDGSLIQIIKLNGEVSCHSRGAFFNDLKFLNDANAVEKMNNLANELLNELNIELNDGDVLYAEVISNKARIVLNYNVDLKLIPLVHILQSGEKTHFDTAYSNQFNESKFDEGHVIVDETGRMFKSKNIDYVEAHKYLGQYFNAENVLELYINDNLDDLAYLYQTEIEMDTILKVFDYLDSVYDYKDMSFHEAQDKDARFEFNLCKSFKSKDELLNHYNNDIFYFLMDDKDIANDLGLKTKQRRPYLKENANKYKDYYLQKCEENQILVNKSIKQARLEDPTLLTVRNLIDYRVGQLLPDDYNMKF